MTMTMVIDFKRAKRIVTGGRRLVELSKCKM
jgi:hypothetical protein